MRRGTHFYGLAKKRESREKKKKVKVTNVIPTLRAKEGDVKTERKKRGCSYCIYVLRTCLYLRYPGDYLRQARPGFKPSPSAKQIAGERGGPLALC